MKAPVDPSTRTQQVTAALPGLELAGLQGTGSAPSLPATAANDVVPAAELAARLVGARVETNMDLAVSALEDVRRLESWVASTKHRLVRKAQQAARAAHTRWVDAHPERAFDHDGPARYGLPRAERLAVAERDGIAQIACALHVSESAASGLLTDAVRLVEHLPRTAAALASGRITAEAAVLIAAEAAEYTDDLSGCVDEDAVARLSWSVVATEDALLGAATRGQTRSQLQARARRVREFCHPTTVAERERVARAERCVRISPDRDGMARLTALLPAAVAWRIDGHLSALARGLQAGEGAGPVIDPAAEASSAFGTEVLSETAQQGAGEWAAGDAATGGTARRTISQLRADVLADLLAGEGPGQRGAATGRAGSPVAGSSIAPRSVAAGDALDTAGYRAPQVLLTMPAATLLGGDDPGILGSFGPIAAADARRLALAASSFMLGITLDSINRTMPDVTLAPVSTAGDGGSDTATISEGTGDVWDGARVLPVLVTNGDQYRIPAALRRALAVRDGTCRFPGCRRSAARCDVDHVVAWADGGRTEPENLAHLCRKHHVLKHHSGWTVDVVHSGESPRGTPSGDAPRGGGSDGAGNTGGGGRPRAGSLCWTSPAGRHYPTEPDDPPPF